MNECALTVDAQGYVYWGNLRLPMRYEQGAIEFVVKHPADRARLKCKRVRVPLEEFSRLEASPLPAPCRPAGKMPRDVSPRNKSVDKST